MEALSNVGHFKILFLLKPLVFLFVLILIVSVR